MDNEKFMQACDKFSQGTKLMKAFVNEAGPGDLELGMHMLEFSARWLEAMAVLQRVANHLTTQDRNIN